MDENLSVVAVEVEGPFAIVDGNGEFVTKNLPSRSVATARMAEMLRKIERDREDEKRAEMEAERKRVLQDEAAKFLHLVTLRLQEMGHTTDTSQGIHVDGLYIPWTCEEGWFREGGYRGHHTGKLVGKLSGDYRLRTRTKMFKVLDVEKVATAIHDLVEQLKAYSADRNAKEKRLRVASELAGTLNQALAESGDPTRAVAISEDYNVYFRIGVGDEQMGRKIVAALASVLREGDVK